MKCNAITRNENAELREREQHTTRPRVDIRETADAVYVEAEMPGVGRDDVDVRLEDGELQILGRVTTQESEGYPHRHVEHSPANYERVFRLSDAIDPEKIEASMKNGVLYLRLAKKEAVKPKTIDVKVA